MNEMNEMIRLDSYPLVAVCWDGLRASQSASLWGRSLSVYVTEFTVQCLSNWARSISSRWSWSL